MHGHPPVYINKICEFCGQKTITPTGYTRHRNTCKLNPQSDNYNKYHEIRYCEKCGKPFTLMTSTHKRFCSYQCANGHIQTEETKQKISNSVSDAYVQSWKTSGQIWKLERSQSKGIRTCKECGKTIGWRGKTGYCKHCASKHRAKTPEYLEKCQAAGRYAASCIKRRSKNEIEFYELCLTICEKVLHNEPIFNGWDADIIMPTFKLAILWNGPWHYKQVTKKHKLKQVQNRDKIKIREIKRCGYKPYVIKDMGSHDSEKVLKEFKKLQKYLKKKFGDIV